MLPVPPARGGASREGWWKGAVPFPHAGWTGEKKSMNSALLRILGSGRPLAVVWGVTLFVLVAGGLALALLPEADEPAPTRKEEPVVATHRRVPAETLAGLRRTAVGEASPASSAVHDNPEHPERSSSPLPERESPGAESRRPNEESKNRGHASQRSDMRAPAAGSGTSPVLQVAVAAGPDPDLLEPSPYGPLPIRAADGRTPVQAYARPFLGDPDKPRIAIIVTKLGLSRARTEQAIADLPPEVSLAFSPYGRGLEDWGRKARKAGHEVLLMIPMEPVGYPDSDPGPLALMTMLTKAGNIDRLHRVLGRMTAYVGIVSEMGSRFTASPQALAPMIADLARRGLLVVDSRTTARSVLADEARTAGLAVAVNDRIIDNIADPSEIDRYLRELETLALRRGYALGMGRPYPVTIARIRAWAKGLSERGFVLAPVSALAQVGQEAP